MQLKEKQLDLYAKKISQKSEESNEITKGGEIISHVKELVGKVIDEIASENPSEEISLGTIVLRCNEHISDSGLKIDINDTSVLKIISEKLKDIDNIQSALTVDKHIKDITDKESSKDSTDGKLLKEKPIKQFNTFAERSFPKENE